MTKPISLRVKRFIIVASVVAVAVFGLTILAVGIMGGVLDTHKTFANICFKAWLVAIWPGSVMDFIYPSGGMATFLFECVVAGVFWACIVELLFAIKTRLWPNKSLQATAAAPSSCD